MQIGVSTKETRPPLSGVQPTKLLYIFFFCVFLAIMWCSPLTSDDVYFGNLELSGIREYLNFSLYYGNGRLLGNFAEVVLTRLNVVRPIIKAVILTSIVILLPLALGMKSSVSLLCSFVLLIGINPSLFAEVYVWTAGFCNYIPPIWISLLIIYLLQKCSFAKSSGYILVTCSMIFVLGIASQLFVEHSTIINFLLSICFVVDKAKSNNRKQIAPRIVWSISTLIGMVIMFAIPVVFIEGRSATSANMTAYRSVNIDDIKTFVKSCAENAMRLSNHYVGTTGITLGVGAISTVHLTQQNRTKRMNRFMFWLCAVVLIYFCACVCFSADEWYGISALLLHSLAIPALIIPILVWIWATSGFDKEQRKCVWMLLGLMVISLAMFLIVSPVPERIIFQSYIFVAAALLINAKHVYRKLCGEIRHNVKTAVLLTAAIIAIVLCLEFAGIYTMENMRKTYILQEIAKGSTEIDIFEMPLEYVYDQNWAYGRIYYHEKMRDITFNTLAYNEWRDLHSGGN